MQGHVLIVGVIAVAAGFVALQLEPEPPAPRTVEIGGEIIPYDPGSGLIIVEQGAMPNAGPIGALVRAP